MCEIVTFVVCSILALYTQFLNYILRYKFFAILSKWRSLEKQLIERWVLTENGFKRLMQLKKFTWFSPLMRSLVDGRCFFPRTRHDLFTFHVVQTCQSTMKKSYTFVMLAIHQADISSTGQGYSCCRTVRVRWLLRRRCHWRRICACACRLARSCVNRSIAARWLQFIRARCTEIGLVFCSALVMGRYIDSFDISCQYRFVDIKSSIRKILIGCIQQMHILKYFRQETHQEMR